VKRFCKEDKFRLRSKLEKVQRKEERKRGKKKEKVK
jgi:hypothetical protein